MGRRVGVQFAGALYGKERRTKANDCLADQEPNYGAR